MSEVGSREVGVSDQTAYEVVLNTDGMAVGPYSAEIAIRSSDPGYGDRTVVVQGAIVSGTPDEAGPRWSGRWTMQ